MLLIFIIYFITLLSIIVYSQKHYDNWFNTHRYLTSAIVTVIICGTINIINLHISINTAYVENRTKKCYDIEMRDNKFIRIDGEKFIINDKILRFVSDTDAVSTYAVVYSSHPDSTLSSMWLLNMYPIRKDSILIYNFKNPFDK